MKFSICKICNNQFKIKPGCKGVYCSVSCAEQGKIIYNRQKAANDLIIKQTNYNLSPKKCIGCNTNLSYEKRGNKYCTLSCSAIFNNKKRTANGWTHSPDTIERIRKCNSENLRGAASPEFVRISARNEDKYIFKECPTCKQQFETTIKWGKAFCSKLCIRTGGLREGSGRAKTGWYNGFYCGSTYELAFLIWHLDHNSNIQRCTKSFDYEYDNKKRKYHPDFEIDGLIYEIKGRYSDIDTVKIKSANAILIDKDDIKQYIKYVTDKFNISKNKLYSLYNK